jgi:hypothetical protein
VENKKQPTGNPPAKSQAGKLIRLNDLIPKKDVSGGRRTVFGGAAVPRAPRRDGK